MSDEEFLNLKNFILSLSKETDKLYEDSVNLCHDINEIKYQVSLFENEVKSLSYEVMHNECKE